MSKRGLPTPIVWYDEMFSPMRLTILSDLHVELGRVELPPCDADVLVLAGDIHQGLESPACIRRQFAEQPVVLVAGIVIFCPRL